MKKLSRVLSFSVGLGVAVALMGHINSGTTRALAITDVKVVNSASAPVPVTGTVKASQNGTWSVGINGTPTVKVASAPPVNVNFPSSVGINGTVPVQNAPGLVGFTPLVVQDFENPARFAYQAECTANAMGIAVCSMPQIPSTKVFVIETVSMTANISQNGVLQLASITTTAGGVSATHFFVPVLTGTLNNGELSFYSANAPVRIYADPNSFVNTEVLSAGSGSTVATWTISGHFVCKGFQQLC